MPTLRKIESTEQKRQLLRLARDTAGAALASAPSEPATEPNIEGTFGGAFVTFWAGEQLRGCVGSFASTDDIASTIQVVTKNSLADRRFEARPITAKELPALEIEISILSNLEPTQDPQSLTPGVHGIMIRRGARSGCFLPKVAADCKWSAEEFLSNCCTMKAGLDADAWQEKGTEVFLFTADVFSESQFP